ncbi:MAG: phosphoribosyl-ATP diphosphatase [Betaproteobacteria bacterium]|nr:phosphoribosyl-ATP diphosphatase [Betaproteobacteria bacterium]
MNTSADTLNRIAATIESRKGQDAGKSYVASLFAKGPNAILKKLGEECAETLIAAKDQDREAILHETADLWFHSMVLLAHANIRIDEVIAELARREGVSGHDEKAARKAT